MPVRGLIFDLFDTLVDLLWENLPSEETPQGRLPASTREMYGALSEFSDASFETFSAALVEGARGFAESHYAHDREVTTAERFEDLAQRLEVQDPRLAERLTQIHMGILRGQVRTLEHHAEILASLRSTLRVGLCSNFSHSQTALEVLEAGGLDEHLDAVVISDAVGIRKPRREIFDEALRGLDLPASDVLHVGDSLRADVGGAQACGISTVWITRRVRDPERRLEEHEGVPPDHVIADLSELPGLLARLS